MKKLVLVLLVAMLSVPAFAANPAITLKKGTVANTVLVYVDATTSAKIASGIGLTVTATGGNITNVVAAKTGESTAASKGYGIFPGQFTYDGGVPAYGSPVADGLNTPVVALEFGALYARSVPANAPDPCSLLCTITVGAGVTAVAVTGDAVSCGTVGGSPAGIIDEDLNAFAVDASVELGAAVCLGDGTGANDGMGFDENWNMVFLGDFDAPNGVRNLVDLNALINIIVQTDNPDGSFSVPVGSYTAFDITGEKDGMGFDENWNMVFLGDFDAPNGVINLVDLNALINILVQSDIPDGSFTSACP